METKKNWKKFKEACNYCGIHGHKAVDCPKKKATEKNGGNDKKQSMGNKNGEKSSVKNEEEKKVCYKCKQRGHATKNCLKKKPKMADAFLVGMALGTEDNDIMDDLHLSSEDKEIGNESILWTDIDKLEVSCMTSHTNHLSLALELVQLSLDAQ